MRIFCTATRRAETFGSLALFCATLLLFCFYQRTWPFAVINDERNTAQREKGRLRLNEHGIEKALLRRSTNQKGNDSKEIDAYGIPEWLYKKGTEVRNPFTYCQVLYPTMENPYDEDFAEAVRLHDIEFKKYKWQGDGYVMMCCQQQVRLMIDLARIPWVKTICEVGFNAGHSALTWLAAKPGTKLYSFDIGSHYYVKPLAAYIAKEFPGRFTLITGNSAHSIPKFIKENPDVHCDIMSIDGAHNYINGVQDFDNFRKMANPVNILHFDDYPDGQKAIRAQGLGKVWEEKVANGQLVPLLRCSFSIDKKRRLDFEKGFAVGRIVV